MTSILDQYEQEARVPRLKISGIASRAENVLGTTGFINMKLEEEPPIFNRMRVNFSPIHPLTHLVAGGNRLVLAMKNKVLLKIQIQKGGPGSGPGAAGPEEIDLSKFAVHSRISGLFLDPTGRHLIVSISGADRETPVDSLYYNWKTNKLKQVRIHPNQLPKWKGHLVTSVGWNPRSSKDEATGAILVGTSKGLIFEAELGAESEGFFGAGCELYWKQVADLGSGAGPLSGIEFWVEPGLVASGSVGDQERVSILVTSLNRLYQFSSRVMPDEKPFLGQVFAVCGDPRDRFQEVPGSSTASPVLQLPFSCLRAFRPSDVAQVPKFIAWTTNAGVFYAEVQQQASTLGDVLGVARLIPFPEEAGRPLSLALTEFHIVLAYQDAVRALSSLNDQMVFEDFVKMESHGPLVGVYRDQKSGILWSFSERSVFQYQVKHESRDAWRIYMDQGKFNLARKFASKDPVALDAVTSKEADFLFDLGKYEESAALYAKTKRSFEQAALKFMDESRRGALRVYLRSKLDGLNAMEKPQRVMLVTWLLELELNALGELRDKQRAQEDGSSAVIDKDYSAAKERVKDFLGLQNVKDAVSDCKSVIYELLSSHGDVDNLVYFAAQMRDFSKVLQHHITRGNFTLALDVLAKHGSVDAFYKHAAALLSAAPRQTVDLLIAQGKRLIPTKLVSPLVAALGSAAEGGQKEEEAIVGKQILRYLLFCVENLDARDAGIHNLLIRLLASAYADPGQLVEYLDSQGRDSDAVCYNPAYALGVCEEAAALNSENRSLVEQLRAAKVVILAAMGLHEKAVDAALSGDPPDISAAQAVADASEEEDADRRKRLWLKIARRVVEGGGKSGEDVAASAVAFLNRCPQGILKLEDILPFFPDFATIDHFKDAVCSALQDYSKHISSLQEEMEEATRSTELIRQEIAQFQNQYCTIGPDDDCLVCGYPLMTKGFFVFPCSHKFHSDCMAEELYPLLTMDERERLEAIRKQLSSMGLKDEIVGSSAGNPGFSKRDQLKAEADEIVASQCLLCGDHMIEAVDKPFIDDADYEEAIKDWL